MYRWPGRRCFYSPCNYATIVLTWTTVTQADRLCYSAAHLVQNIRGLFTDSSNTDAVDLSGMFYKSPKMHRGLLTGWVIISSTSVVEVGQVVIGRKKYISKVWQCVKLCMTHTHTQCVGLHTSLPLWHHHQWQRAKDNREELNWEGKLSLGRTDKGRSLTQLYSPRMDSISRFCFPLG